MNKFKAGDEVRAISESNGWGAIEKGDIGKVKRCFDYGLLSIEFPNQKSWSCSEKNVELVEPKSDQDQVKALLKGANIGATMIGDALAKSQEAELVTRYGDRYKQYVEVATCGGSGGVTYGGVPVAIYPNPPHKHRDLIIAWANGAEIEYWERLAELWKKTDRTPSWYEGKTYRIKPTKTPLELKIEKCEAKLAKLKGRL